MMTRLGKITRLRLVGCLGVCPVLTKREGYFDRCCFQAAPATREPRWHRTGRNIQLNIKARADTIERFYALADRNGWVLGEAFERAVAALERNAAN